MPLCQIQNWLALTQGPVDYSKQSQNPNQSFICFKTRELLCKFVPNPDRLETWADPELDPKQYDLFDFSFGFLVFWFFGTCFVEQQDWVGEGYMQPAASIDEEIRSQMETGMVTPVIATVSGNIDVGEQEKGILGPGPADLRLP